MSNMNKQWRKEIRQLKNHRAKIVAAGNREFHRAERAFDRAVLKSNRAQNRATTRIDRRIAILQGRLA